MTSYHDPYREIEIYLKQAEDEITKAFDELLEQEKRKLPSRGLANGDNVLPPPPAFRTSSRFIFQKRASEKNSNCKTIHNNIAASSSTSPVCYDSSDLNSRSTSSANYSNGHHSSYPLQKSLSCPATQSYFSPKNGEQRSFTKKPLTNGAVNSLKQENEFSRILRPSLSFPEGSIDDYLRDSVLPQALDDQFIKDDEKHCFTPGAYCNTQGSIPCEHRRPRSRSFSETIRSKRAIVNLEECYNTFPRPPSGDVNLLSIWADNLVIAINNSLPEDPDDSISSSTSPMSEHIPSPTKVDVSFGCPIPSATTSGRNVNEDSFGHQRNTPQTTPSTSSFKLMTPSPDSGICQIFSDIPDVGEDVVDCVKSPTVLPVKLKVDVPQSSNDNGQWTPPPPQFEDRNSKIFSYLTRKENDNFNQITTPYKVLKSQNVQGPQILATREMKFVPDNSTEMLNISNYNRVRVVPSSLAEDKASAVKITNTLAEAPAKISTQNCVNSSVPTTAQSNDAFSGDSTNATLPKLGGRVSDIDRFTSSLPRDVGRVPATMSPDDGPLRSASSSAVSSISQVSVDELAAFMWKVKKSTYYPPPRVDVSVDVKDDILLPDELNRDAVTQTTPETALSRSSSFTWVTECDCSDWDSSNGNSASEDSLLVFSCSNSDPEKKAVQASTSPSSTTDDDPEAPQNSESSSLYLSAFSDASPSLTSDSSPDEPEKPLDQKKVDHKPTAVQDSPMTLITDNISLPASALVDTVEETATETLSLHSVSSNSDVFNKELSSSVPSSLTATAKNDNETYRSYPIEANVLVLNEMNKSVSAPVLLRQKKASSTKSLSLKGSSKTSPSTALPPISLPIVKSHSVKQLNELQALEACSWLRAAGFPQYAQMYEDNLFPLDIVVVQKDHPFLAPEFLQPLQRRVNTLNRCVRIRMSDGLPKPSDIIDSDDEEQNCALSTNWKFQRLSGRWSRIDLPKGETSSSINGQSTNQRNASRPSTPARKFLTPEDAYSSSHDSVFLDEHHSSLDSVRRSTPHDGEPILAVAAGRTSPESSSGSGGTLSIASEETTKPIHRTKSERLKHGASAFFHRMDSFRSKSKKESDKKNEAFPNRSADGSSCGSQTPSPHVRKRWQIHLPGSPHFRWNVMRSQKRDDTELNTQSDSECPLFLVSEMWQGGHSKEIKVPDEGSVPVTESPSRLLDTPSTSNEYYEHLGVRPKIPKHYPHNSSERSEDDTGEQGQKRYHGAEEAHMCLGSEEQGDDLHQNDKWKYDGRNGSGRRRPTPREEGRAGQNNRTSHYDNCPAPLAVFNQSLGRNYGQTEECSDPNADLNDAEIISVNPDRRDSGVGASLTRCITDGLAPWHSFSKQSTTSRDSCVIMEIFELSAPQILMLKKLAMLKMTTLMEKYTASSRTGWNWAVPKFMRRIGNRDFKDMNVFGVPLMLVLERTGRPLPTPIVNAIDFLKSTSMNCVGLFRKSGVRSRIQRLRNMAEEQENLMYNDQQAYDVADMLKLYFRELPEVLLTNKLSETFISIYQCKTTCIPDALRDDAVQTSILLLPDENKEVLYILLAFLHEFSEHSDENQMTAANLAMCFAPSLFRLSTPRSTNASPRRRKTVGVPDMKELNEHKAACECLTNMISKYLKLFTVRGFFKFHINEVPSYQNNAPRIEYFEPSKLLELSSLVYPDLTGWREYIDGCIVALLKEGKEKYKGWIGVCQTDGVDLAYKKPGDGHPLRLWKVCTAIEAPPTELLNRLMRDRSTWNNEWVTGNVVQILDKDADLYCYMTSSPPPLPPTVFYTIRSWKTMLPRGACVLIEASVRAPARQLIENKIPGVVLASRYLIEPCGSGKSRVTHISRIDARGRSPDWYNRAYGHVCIENLMKLRASFSHIRTEGPETKV